MLDDIAAYLVLAPIAVVLIAGILIGRWLRHRPAPARLPNREVSE